MCVCRSYVASCTSGANSDRWVFSCGRAGRGRRLFIPSSPLDQVCDATCKKTRTAKNFLGCNVTEGDTSDQRVTIQRNPTLDLARHTHSSRVWSSSRCAAALLQAGLLNAQEPEPKQVLQQACNGLCSIAAGLQGVPFSEHNGTLFCLDTICAMCSNVVKVGARS
eukprot:COSAG01_NODE_2148_length_8299_cov_283.948177_3_plen_165_part_00